MLIIDGAFIGVQLYTCTIHNERLQAIAGPGGKLEDDNQKTSIIRTLAQD